MLEGGPCGGVVIGTLCACHNVRCYGVLKNGHIHIEEGTRNISPGNVFQGEREFD